MGLKRAELELGVANKETWTFLQDIFDYLQARYPIKVFSPRKWPFPFFHSKMDHYLLRQSLKKFMQEQEVILFEWASELVVEASDMWQPGYAALVVRLHRYEMYKWVDRIKWGNVAFVLLNTETMRQKLLERTGIPPERAVVVPPVGILKERICREPRKLQGTIGILCSLIPRKRVYELILAFAKLIQDRPGLELHIGGDRRGDYRSYYEALQALVEKLNISESVNFNGRVEDKWSWYSGIDIFVSYSYSEGMQVAPLEAAASGCYCLSHWWEGAEEIFPWEQLFLTDAEFIGKALDFLQAPDEQRYQMRLPFLQFADEVCDPEKINRKVEEVLLASVGSSTSPIRE